MRINKRSMFPQPSTTKSTGLNVLIEEMYLITYEISVHGD